MEPIVLYFLKSAIVSAVFLGVYHLFLKRDTFFMENRLFLLSGLVLSLLFPLIKIERVVVAPKPILIGTGSSTVGTEIDNLPGIFSTENVLLAIYLSVCAVLLVKLLVQLGSLRKLAKN